MNKISKLMLQNFSSQNNEMICKLANFDSRSLNQIAQEEDDKKYRDLYNIGQVNSVRNPAQPVDLDSKKAQKAQAALEAFYNQSMDDGGGGLDGSPVKELPWTKIKEIVSKYGWKTALGILAAGGLTFGLVKLIKALKRRKLSKNKMKIAMAKSGANAKQLGIVDKV